MRTKSLILSAMVGIAGVVSSFAQGNVYSVNVVGYINLDLPGGFSMIANQLDNGQGNRLADLIPQPEDLTTVFKFLPAVGAYESDFFLNGAGWLGDNPEMLLSPGEGVFIQLPNPATVTFVGEVKQGDLSTPIVEGFSIVSSQVPQSGLITTDLGYQPSDLDNVFQFDNATGAYLSSFYLNGVGWLGDAGGEPTISVGESFFLQSTDAKSWDRTFTVQ